ncbi:hypothetical protein BT93_L5114 [Corymbia citriodora subsp. variegata]|uniref:NADH:ubiquinone oxidoreductase intermediate-associated protein 30 domain-containing protein n=1 Tax=Corymbia citriodora subsp. variegata TaxID=360336 RepID=A0A8T0CGB9_CORYI|nr:hypothetical protein BT93_L5114 [Corymbia citriodora subsp. variegata]
MLLTNRTDVIFGGTSGWNSKDWTDSDDRVRGGSSQICEGTAQFCGKLDTTTLGGAGFASQRTTEQDKTWDFTSFTGLELLIHGNQSDDKKYTFILKDTLPERRSSTGPDQSTISWEYDFTKNENSAAIKDDVLSVVMQWSEFKPTYRGRPRDDASPLRLDHIKQMSFMMRSFFDTQSGDFQLTILSVQGIKAHDSNLRSSRTSIVSHDSTVASIDKPVMTIGRDNKPAAPGFWSWLASCCRL